MKRMKPMIVFTSQPGAGPGASGGSPLARPPGVFARVLGAIAAVVLLASAVLFSAVLLVVLLLVATAGLGWFWWQTRAVRRVLRERASTHPDRPADSAPGDPISPARAAVRTARRVDEVSDAEIIREVKVRDRL